MRRYIGIAIMLVSAMGICGCGKDLTIDENRMIGEYAAELLLKYDADYQDSLEEEDTTESSKQNEATEHSSEISETEATTEATSEESSSASTEEASTEEQQDPPSVDSDIQDIAEIIGIEGIQIKYNRCMFLERYPSVDQDGSFIYLEADPGYKLVVVKFDIENTQSQDIQVDLLNTDIEYRLVFNQQRAAKPMLTILMDDLSTFKNVVPGKTKQDGVLVFQMAQHLVEEIEQLDMRITYKEQEYVIPIN